MKRLLLPALGFLLTVIVVMEVRAMKNAKMPASPPPAQPVARISAEGRVTGYPGAEVTVGAEVSGVIDRVLVEEKARVKKGDVVVVLRAADQRAAIAEAKARVAEAEADIRLFELEVDRARRLWEDEVASKQNWEHRQRDLDAARARRTSLRAEVTRLEAVVAKTVIYAPIDGTIVERLADAGESINIADPIVTIADLSRTRIEAEVDEFDAGRVAVGAPVEVSAEGYAATWKGVIEEVPDTVTSRRLKPQDMSKPIDTRVLLVKVALAESTPLKLGQRVEASITPR